MIGSRALRDGSSRSSALSQSDFAGLIDASQASDLGLALANVSLALSVVDIQLT